MKRQIVRRVTILMVLLTIALVNAAATANGQSQYRLRARIPFEFIVGDKTLAAGDYQVLTIGEALAVRNTNSKNNAIRISMTVSAKENQPASLVFHRYGNTYFLSEVWEGGDRVGRRLTESRQERAMKRELSRIATNGTSHYEEVVVLASR